MKKAYGIMYLLVLLDVAIKKYTHFLKKKKQELFQCFRLQHVFGNVTGLFFFLVPIPVFFHKIIIYFNYADNYFWPKTLIFKINICFLTIPLYDIHQYNITLQWASANTND